MNFKIKITIPTGKSSPATAVNSGHTATLRSTQISLRETSYVRRTLSEIPPLANKRKNTALIPDYAQNERFLKKSASKCSKGLTYLFPYS